LHYKLQHTLNQDCKTQGWDTPRNASKDIEWCQTSSRAATLRNFRQPNYWWWKIRTL